MDFLDPEGALHGWIRFEDRTDSPTGEQLAYFQQFGRAAIHCPLCHAQKQWVTMAFLVQGEDGCLAIVELVGQRGVAFTQDEPVYLKCPRLGCKRRHGPYTARGLYRRLRKLQPLTVV